MMRWLGLTLAGFSAVSCDEAALSAPDGAEADRLEIVADWPRLPPGKTFGRVLGVAVAPDGRVWVAHTANGQARNTRPISGPTLAVLDAATGELVAEHGAGLFRLPHALAFDEAGRLWVTDADANEIVVLDVTGTPNVVQRLGAE